MSEGQRGNVIKAYTAQYPDPIRMKAGDVLTLDGRRDNWQGHIWVWCIHADGRSGWVPDGFIAEMGDQATALVDYDAIELSVAADEFVIVLQERNGWYWCKNESGRQGWVPVENIALQPASQ